MISDRFALTAAHCQLYFGDRGGPFDNPKTVLLRDGTGAASLHVVKRAFSHPEYSFPSLYSNIALLELGRGFLAEISTNFSASPVLKLTLSNI